MDGGDRSEGPSQGTDDDRRGARLQAVLDAADDAVIAIDERGLVDTFNRAAELMFGWSAEEMVGRNVSVLMPEPDRSHHDEFLRHASTGRKRRVIGTGRRLHALRRDGSVFPIQLAVNEHDSAGGRVFTAFIRDLSAQDRLEQQLRQSQKMEAVGTLAGGIAHDFNNILQGILSCLEVAQALPEEADDQLQLAGRFVERGSGLVQQILAFSRRDDEGRARIRPAAALGEVQNMLRSTLPSPVAIHFDVDVGLFEMVGSPTGFHQVLLNLCNNGVQALPARGGTLSVVARIRKVSEPPARGQVLSAGEYLEITVTDTGSGIAPEHRDRIFEPFFTTKKRGQGTGLGLSVVHGIVQRQGGAIWLDRSGPSGSTFVVMLPVVEAAGVESSRHLGEPPTGRGRVLIVDDEQALARAGGRLLRSLGYEVEVHSDPEVADAVLARGAFDLLVTDQTMPGLSGTELADRARARHPGLAVVLMSGHRLQDTSDGVDQVLKKPFDRRALAFAAAAALRRRRRAR